MPGTYISPAETGFYYVASRYYDAEIGRFLNADGQLNSDILGFNLYTYCGNNPISRADFDDEAWWVVAGALVGGIVSVGAKIVSNRATGKKWNDGVIGAFAGAAVESIVNETASYTPYVSKMNGNKKTEKITKNNLTDSVSTVVGDTVVNGTIATITGGIAGKIVPTNPYWIKPQKFKSSFLGNYAKKSELQALAQGLLDFCYSGFNYLNTLFSTDEQKTFVKLYPEI